MAGIKSLKLKPKLTSDSGEEYVDLSASSMRKKVDTPVKSVYVVEDDTEMRPDLISYQFYGTAEYSDVICKANNIFNPFSIKKGDVLVIPVVDNDNDIFEQPGKVEKKDLRSKFTDTERMSQKDKSRVERLKAKAQGKTGATDQPLPPNMLPEGTSSKEKKDGQIILGANLPRRDDSNPPS